MRFNRIIERNPPLCDGTPKYERGYRVKLHWDYPINHPHKFYKISERMSSCVYKSPLLPNRGEAEVWFPDVECIARHFGFAP